MDSKFVWERERERMRWSERCRETQKNIPKDRGRRAGGVWAIGTERQKKREKEEKDRKKESKASIFRRSWAAGCDRGSLLRLNVFSSSGALSARCVSPHNVCLVNHNILLWTHTHKHTRCTHTLHRKTSLLLWLASCYLQLPPWWKRV